MEILYHLKYLRFQDLFYNFLLIFQIICLKDKFCLKHLKIILILKGILFLLRFLKIFNNIWQLHLLYSFFCKLTLFTKKSLLYLRISLQPIIFLKHKIFNKFRLLFHYCSFFIRSLRLKIRQLRIRKKNFLFIVLKFEVLFLLIQELFRSYLIAYINQSLNQIF